ncbi:pyridoxamine 5'-phosphate oxidase family protein [Mucilaginibacter sp.]|uniref:pyridoxamine 5'-phosphate oxidase family protein n=1 Tax=Mucilaginibacter sp. TaxID=1882438 RepID=UPI002634FCCD|nr:pyridoxamine 5'-phosphate oxidase family protein [Mucilaginibacter sp.]MDB4918306.1 pyridoxamine 5-phosphate oxidase [Mucilaginibacter sp.]
MLGELNEAQIEDLLMMLPVGRIGCHADGVTYIVPINYVYEANTIYAHSAKGMKIDIMRKNPDVCFQVDAINDLVNWESVIAWGRFEEITDMQERQHVMQMIINRVMPHMRSETAQPSHGFIGDASDVGDDVKLILYKISLNKKTGRFEKG